MLKEKTDLSQFHFPTLNFSLALQLCAVEPARLFHISFFFSFYVKRKQTTTKRKAHARDRELEIISKAWHTSPVVVCACRASAREFFVYFFLLPRFFCFAVQLVLFIVEKLKGQN